MATDDFETLLVARLHDRAGAIRPTRRPLDRLEHDARRRRARRRAALAGAMAGVTILASVLTAAAMANRGPETVVASSGPAAAYDHAEGQRLWAENCSACHGMTGGGGAGRQVSDGLVLRTFPDRADELAYVRNGDAGLGPYGSPSRPGGQHVAPYDGAFMPGFPTLTDDELLAVVRYEREVLSGERP